MNKPDWHQISNTHKRLAGAIFLLGRACEAKDIASISSWLVLVEEELQQALIEIDKQKRDWITHLSKKVTELETQNLTQSPDGL